MQNDDQRIAFVIPYQQRYVIIGTTDQVYAGDPGNVQISRSEIDYLCEIVNEYFDKNLDADDVISTCSGVLTIRLDRLSVMAYYGQ